MDRKSAVGSPSVGQDPTGDEICHTLLFSQAKESEVTDTTIFTKSCSVDKVDEDSAEGAPKPPIKPTTKNQTHPIRQFNDSMPLEMQRGGVVPFAKIFAVGDQKTPEIKPTAKTQTHLVGQSNDSIHPTTERKGGVPFAEKDAAGDQKTLTIQQTAKKQIHLSGQSNDAMHPTMGWKGGVPFVEKDAAGDQKTLTREQDEEIRTNKHRKSQESASAISSAFQVGMIGNVVKVEPVCTKEKTLAEHREDSWDHRLEQLRRYKVDHGNADVPSYKNRKQAGDPLLYELSNWVQVQRRAYSLRVKDKGRNENKYQPLDDQRMEKLEEIGFSWSSSRNERWWQERYEKLKTWQAAAGHCRVPDSYHDRELALFVARIRLSYARLQRGEEMQMKLTQERLEKLKVINFEFSLRPDRRKKTWEERYQQLVEFFNEHGHCRVPCKYSKVLLLPRWVKEQRESFQVLFEEVSMGGRDVKKMKMDQYKKLESLGFHFSGENSNVHKCSTPWSFCTCNFENRPLRRKGRKRKGSGSGNEIKQDEKVGQLDLKLE